MVHPPRVSGGRESFSLLFYFMGMMEQYVKYNEEFKLAICRPCRVGLPPSNILRHFRMHHGETWMAHKKELQSHVKTLDLTSLEGLTAAQPEGVREPIPGINVVAGWCCEQDSCQIAGMSEKYLRQYAQKAHGWTANDAKTRFPCQLQRLLGNPYIKYLTALLIVC